MKTFLTAEWKELLVATYEADKKLLQKFLPRNIELNDWNGKYFLSVVGFMFRNPFILNMKMPFFHAFPEVNLRMYVKCKLNNKWKTGVVFIKEISPHWLIGITAKLLYHENFVTRAMQCEQVISEKDRTTWYAWKHHSKWNHIYLRSELAPTIPEPGSIESFISGQYTAFTKRSNADTCVFEIQHRPWLTYPALGFSAEIDAAAFKVECFSEVFVTRPIATFFMDGSFTRVSRPGKVYFEL